MTPTQLSLETVGRQFPLARPAPATDKNARGRVLIVAAGGSAPGAVLLTGLAALRAGAGKLQIACDPLFLPGFASAVPEAGFLPVSGDRLGELGPEAAESLADAVRQSDAVVIGPGTIDKDKAGALARRLSEAGGDARLVIDAAALAGFGLEPPSREAVGRLVLTPHHGEMASLTSVDLNEVDRRPLEVARDAARRLGAVVALKAAETLVVTPDGLAWVHEHGSPGLATSGSGDVLAGVIAGLLARGAAPAAATAWGVCVHGAAGARLSERIGPIGFLARDLLEDLPRIIAGAHARGEDD